MMMSKTNKSILAVALGFGLSVTAGTAAADGGDFSLDFTASEPTSYDHSTGGGNYNMRTINTDVVESLEGGDFACGDTVSFLTQVRVDAGATGTQTAELRYQFTSYSTGKPWVALVDNVAGTSAAVNPNPPDEGTSDDGGSTATATAEDINGPGTFIKKTFFERDVLVTDLEAGETVVVRTDVMIVCEGSRPTGNMQARLTGATANPGGADADTISVGDQTIPFKRVGDITCDPKDPKCV